MAQQIRAEYTDGKLTPLEPLDIPEGTIVTLNIEDPTPNAQHSHSAVEIAQRLIAEAPSETWDNLPQDSAQNLRHYLYGHPKENL